MMEKIAVQLDHRPSELYANLTVQWARQTAAYSRSVRLFQESIARRRARQARPLRQVAQVKLAPRSGAPVVDLLDGLASGAGLPVAETVPSRSRARPGRIRVGQGGPLTARQLEIAELIAQGLTNSQIATRIVVSRGTVGNHVGHMLRRLGVHNRAQIAAWAIRHAGEVSAEDLGEGSPVSGLPA